MISESDVPIPEFYAGKSVFITGGSGYLGKVLLEKLLYSCPSVDRVFVLLRDKKNVSAERRLQIIIDLPIFARLRRERPQDLHKLVLLKGDISAHNLNLIDKDLVTVIEKVSVVIHAAASIKFNEPLKTALSVNFEGTRNVLNLCHLMKNLQVFVHISTAYCQCNQTIIEEKVYPPPVSVEEAYKFAEENHSEAETAKFLKGRPNTYTFTKALVEHLVSETHGDIPAVIIRPSIVTPSIEEPIKGWVDNWFGATGLLTAIAKGICRVVHTHDEHIIDLIPVDYVCNFTLLAAARATSQTDVAVYNACSSYSNPITMKRISKIYSAVAVDHRFNILPWPGAILCSQRWVVHLNTLLTYAVAYTADMFVRLSGNRPKYVKLIDQVVRICNTLDYFTSHSWVMKTDRSIALFDSLSQNDARLFPCLARDIVWTKYLLIYFQGVSKYLIGTPTTKPRI